MNEGPLAFDLMGWGIGLATAVAGLVAGTLVRYYSERSAIVQRIGTMFDKVEAKWEQRFEHHEETIKKELDAIHNRIERVENRAEDRLTTQINDVRQEINSGFDRVMKQLRKE